MTFTIDLQPEIERGLLAQAQAKGVSLADYVKEIVSREVHTTGPSQPHRTGQSLIDVCAEVRGVLTDEDIDTLFTRNRSMSRPVDLS